MEGDLRWRTLDQRVMSPGEQSKAADRDGYFEGIDSNNELPNKEREGMPIPGNKKLALSERIKHFTWTWCVGMQDRRLLC